MALFEMIGKLGLNTAEFQGGMKRAESIASAASNKIKGFLAEAFTATAVVAFAKHIASLAGNILDLADAFDTTTDQIQIMQEAAARNGVQVEQLLQSTVKLAQVRQKAIEGDKNAIAAFNRLGISIESVTDANKSNYDLMIEVASAFANSNRTFADQAAVMDILGGKSIRLMGAIKSLKELGTINLISEEELTRIDAAADAIEEAGRSIQRVLVEVIGGALKAGQLAWESYIQTVMQFFMELQKGGRDVIPRAIRAAIRGALSPFGQEPEPPKGPPTVPIVPEPMPPGYTPEGRSGSDPFGPPKPGQTWEQFNQEFKAKPKENAAAAERERMQRPSTGNLASIGGLYFGADYNMRLMTTMQKQLSALEKIDVNTKETNNILND